MRRTLVVGVVATLLALLAPTPGSAAPAALVPAPGTGHGVLTGAAPDEDAGSFEYRPGLGDDCVTPPGAIRVQPFNFGRNPLGYGEVGLPVALCFGRFPADEIDVTITAPDGTTFAPRDSIGSPRDASASTAVFLLVRPRPPGTTFRVEDLAGRSVSGRLAGNGSGTYTVVASGGTTATVDFVLVRAARPRLVNLTVHRAGRMLAQSTPGGRLRFGTAGTRPLATFRVGVFGPEPTSGDESDRPLRTTITARADRRGEAVVTLDVASTSPRGSFVAVLEPQVPVADPDLFDPRVAIFEIEDRPRS